MPSATGDAAVWVVDLLRGVRTRLTPPAPYSYTAAVLSADGNRVLYVSPETGTWDLYVRNVDGSGNQQPFLLTDRDKVVYDWSRDGSRILFSATGGGTSDLWIYDSQTQTSEVLIEGDPTYVGARFSPGGRHVAYMTDESGRMEVFIQTIDGGARAQVSTAGGAGPHWRDDGREIVYVDPDWRMMAVSVDLGANGVTLGTPSFLFALDRTVVSADAAGDHKRFLLAITDEQDSAPLHVILGWQAGL
jgi:Tol biopolymer transport system component